MARSCLIAAAMTAVRRSGGVRPVMAFSLSTTRIVPRRTDASSALFMTTSTPASSSSAKSTASTVVPRLRAVDATEPSNGSPVVVKGWVRTVRKQKTVAFVEVNDGSNLSGIQCVLTFDDVDEASKQGACVQQSMEIATATAKARVSYTHLYF